ncbi:MULTISPECIES: hypothetical protein [unclassified Nocardia]|uniref:hypothetical protein n=1 Tax=unclassified Nocardia TaxID=2637762 RepID=UPI00278C2637|nr:MULTISPECIES: hypothetical protein [unclassified Nocardia]
MPTTHPAATAPAAARCVECLISAPFDHPFQTFEALWLEMQRCDHTRPTHAYRAALPHLRDEIDQLPNHHGFTRYAYRGRLARQAHHAWHTATGTTCTYRTRFLELLGALAAAALTSGEPR